MRTIDEAIASLRRSARKSIDYEWQREQYQLAKWLEELKEIKEMDLSIPQHFTKEQSDWIKAYCIQRNKEFYTKAVNDFAELLREKRDKRTMKVGCDDLELRKIAEQLKAGAFDRSEASDSLDEITIE